MAYVCLYTCNKVFSRGIKDLTQTNETACVFDHQQAECWLFFLLSLLQEPNVSILIRLVLLKSIDTFYDLLKDSVLLKQGLHFERFHCR